ncbi:MAG: hypothetical protein IJ404_06765 [Clostridia bacterium]|nr:hypothetical protein [Clostridia bacterium]
MKFLGKISIFLLSAAIFMSALVVFADNTNAQASNWPSLKFTISISEKNKISENDEATLSAKISDAVSAPFFALTRDYPDLTMWTTGFSTRSSYSILTSGTKKTYTLTSIEYTFNGNQNYGDPSGMLDQLNNVVNSFTPSGSTMYDKLIDIHDFICEINTYVKEDDGGLYCYSAYGSLVNHKSVCEGYAEAFKLLCDRAGIECILVTGMSLPSNGTTMEGHMWNLVHMDDGEWYAVDVTWDDAGDIAENYNYFLVGTDTVIRGKKFTESHFASYDFIEIGGETKTIADLEYPTLSSIAYDKENGRTNYTYGGERFHYNALDDIQKEIYDKMLDALRNNMPTDPSKTPAPDTSEGNGDDPVTTTKPDSTTPEETTTADETSTADTTKGDTTDTTRADETTTADTTTPEDTTEPPVITTTEPNDTTTENVTDPSDTTPSSTTKSPSTSTQKETDPPASSTTEKVDTSGNDTVSDTTENPDNTGSITMQGRDNGRRIREMQKLYKTVTTVVIVSAITSLSIIIGIFVIRYAKKHK